jgi:hypothetical protein
MRDPFFLGIVTGVPLLMCVAAVFGVMAGNTALGRHINPSRSQ